jgi:predicted nucleic acid-binding protein
MPYLIDSDVLIDISQGIKAAREYVDALTEEWGISQVSALELIVGARDQGELATIDAFLSAYAITLSGNPRARGPTNSSS